MVKNIRADESALLESLKDEVHLWCTNPDIITDPGQLAYYTTLLSPDEVERHRRFHFERDRMRYLVSHALVRTVLSKYTGTDPSDWRFSYNAHGRPEIDSTEEILPLRFNLTHTAGLAACLVTLDMDCGIDTEQISRSRDLRGIAEKMFALSELDSLKDTDDMTFRQGFFDYWTLREAYCKALGVGLAGSTKDFHFEIRDGNRARIHFSPPSESNACDWQFSLLYTDPTYVTAIAVHRPGLPDRKIATWTITP